jgi:signal transduction histidine kinase
MHGTERDRLKLDHHRYEIGILAGAFNDLIGKIRWHIEREDLERRIRQSHETTRFESAKRNWLENLGILGHEIRSPLQGLLSIHGPESESRKYLDRISAALPHLQLGLTPEQAAESRVLDVEPLNINEFLAEIANNACAVMADVIFEGFEEQLICNIDPDTFANVLDNVLQNADRHRTSGTSVVIRLSTRENGAVIEVTNLGAPIAPEVIDSMFKFGVSTTLPEKGYGRGIGLWQSQLYIDRMQGTIRAIDLVEEGCVCIEIWLPLAKDSSSNASN